MLTGTVTTENDEDLEEIATLMEFYGYTFGSGNKGYKIKAGKYPLEGTSHAFTFRKNGVVNWNRRKHVEAMSLAEFKIKNGIAGELTDDPTGIYEGIIRDTYSNWKESKAHNYKTPGFPRVILPEGATLINQIHDSYYIQMPGVLNTCTITGSVSIENPVSTNITRRQEILKQLKTMKKGDSNV
jgi:hypothetical protein